MSNETIRKTVEEWRAIYETRRSTFLAAKAFNKWPEGRMLSREQYVGGVTRAKRLRIV